MVGAELTVTDYNMLKREIRAFWHEFRCRHSPDINQSSGEYPRNLRLGCFITKRNPV
jgi:hypothetical protein